MMLGMVNWGAQHTLGDKPADGARTLIQFRMNVNYFADEAEARENCRMLRRHLELFKQADVKASYWFTGLAAEQVHRLDPEFIRRLNEAGMPVAHHGANRPPNPQPIHRVKGEKLGPTESHRSGLPVVMAAAPLPKKVEGEEVVAAAKQVCVQMTGRIPSQISAGDLKLNSAEFLLAMAQTINAVAKSGIPMPLSLHAVDLLPRSVRENRLADPLTKLQFWTFKPERWKESEKR